jgi:hypothetical protein
VRRFASRALSALTVFFKYGKDKLIGESVQTIRDEDAEAYIRQEVGVHVDPVIAQYDDPDDCERKEEILEIRFLHLIVSASMGRASMIVALVM